MRSRQVSGVVDVRYTVGEYYKGFVLMTSFSASPWGVGGREGVAFWRQAVILQWHLSCADPCQD